MVAEATPRALLRAQVVVLVVPEGSEAPRLALVVLEAAVALEVALVAEEVAEGASEAAIVEASEVASAAAVEVEVETDLAGAVVASVTKVRTAMAHLTAPLLVLEDHEVGLVAAAAVATMAVAVIVVETVIEATATVAAAVPQGRLVMRELSGLLADQPFFGGSALSLADIAVAPQLDFLSMTPEWDTLMADSPTLMRWLDAMRARPSMQATTIERVRASVGAN